MNELIKVTFLVIEGLDRQRIARRIARVLDKTSSKKAYFSSPEDTILAKLEWYKLAARASEVQWHDFISIFQQQGESLDIAYLRETATIMGLVDLLKQVMKEM